MHELQVTQRILGIVLRFAAANDVKKVLAVRLTISELSELEDEWLQQYFDYFSKDTVAEQAKLQIERTPIEAVCQNCGQAFEIKAKKIAEGVCPECHSKDWALTSTHDYYVKDMEVI